MFNKNTNSWIESHCVPTEHLSFFYSEVIDILFLRNKHNKYTKLITKVSFHGNDMFLTKESN